MNNYILAVVAAITLILGYKVYTTPTHDVVYVMQESKFDDLTSFKDVDIESMFKKKREIVAYLNSSGYAVVSDKIFLSLPANSEQYKLISFDEIKKMVLQEKLQSLSTKFSVKD